MPDEAMELKYCELCGRPFTRPQVPGVRVNARTGAVESMPKQRDCRACIDNPPAEEEEVQYTRSYRVSGIKLKL